MAAILAAAAAKADRAAAGRDVLVIQDTTEINYQAKAGRKTGLGKVGNGADVGLFAHPAIVVDAEDGALLGLAAAAIWSRERVKGPDYRLLPIEEKESHRWLDTARSAIEALPSAAGVTIVADREGDIYEVLARLPGPTTHVLVRLCRNRRLAGGGTVRDALAAGSTAGRVRFDIPARPGRQAREVVADIRFARLHVVRPKTRSGGADPASVPVHVVEIVEVDPPAGAEPIHWELVTSHPVETVADALRIVALYRRRWGIEQVFRTMKSQILAIEDTLLETREALERLTAATLVVASQVMQLVQGRDQAGAARKAEVVFDPPQQAPLAALAQRLDHGRTRKQQNPHPPQSLAWAAWIIARLGGWTGYASERPPGPVTMARGLERFQAIAEGFNLAAQLNTSIKNNVCKR